MESAMRATICVFTVAACLTSITATAWGQEPVPKKVGECVATSVKDVSSRLEGVPDSGSAIEYANGVYQVSYDTIAGITASRAGDRIKLCLTALPSNCPPGDDRGKTYRATNLRTNKSWEAPDSEHMCGGA
jgi:hypothetical protein